LSQRIEQEIAHGKKISDNAESIWRWTTPTGRIRSQRRAGYFIELGKINPASHVLEIGCGTGIFTKMIYDATKASVIAIDISHDLLDQAKTKIPGVEFRIEDAMKMSFNENTFDCVFGSSIIHHLDLEKASEEIFRVLKSGGRIVFAEPNMLNPHIFIQKNVPFVKRMVGDTCDEKAIVRWKYQSLLKKIGFRKVEIFPYDFLYPLIPEFMIPFVNSAGKIFEKIPLVKEIAGSVIIYAEK
jgi:ubiquinone/menaquinone biosynthesis C-methylase UbiE